MKMKKENHDSDSKGKQANPPAESPHRELVTLWSSRETRPCAGAVMISGSLGSGRRQDGTDRLPQFFHTVC